MSAFVSLSGLSWSTPDGTPLFTDLDLAFGPERTGIVGRNGTGKSTLVHLIVGNLLPSAGKVQVSGSVAMVRQEALEHPDDTVADLLGLRIDFDLLDRTEAGLADVNELADADWTLPARLETALLRFNLVVGSRTPLAMLSGGQRSRVALASLILAEPDFLILDESTNNLDQDVHTAATWALKMPRDA